MTQTDTWRRLAVETREGKTLPPSTGPWDCRGEASPRRA